MRKLVLMGAMLALMAAPALAQVKVGILMGFSGPLAALSPSIEAGALLAVEQVNAAGGIHGNKVETISRDTATNPSTGRDAAARLVDVDRVPAIIGALSSGVTTAASSVTVPGQVVLVSPSSTAPTLTNLDDKDYFFRTCPSDALQGKVQGQVARNAGYDTAGVIYVNNPYGKGLADNFKAAFEAAGGKITAMVPYEESKPSYRGEVQSALRGEPKVLNVIAYPADGNKQLVTAIEQGFEGEFIFPDGMKSEDVAKGPAMERLDGSLGTAAGALESAAGRAFEAGYDAYAKSSGKAVDKSAPYRKEAYDAMATVLLSIAAAGPNFSSMSQRDQGQAIRDNMRKVTSPGGTAYGYGELDKALAALKRGEKVNYNGVSGAISFDAKGDVTEAAYELWMFKKGRVASVWTVE